MGTAPLAVMVYVKAAPTAPLAVSALLMPGGVGVGGGAAMVIVSVFASEPMALVADRLTVNVPGAGGVPESRPVEASKFIHACRPVTARVMGVVPSALSV